jgi:hypothetical protein
MFGLNVFTASQVAYGARNFKNLNTELVFLPTILIKAEQFATI